MWEFSGFEPYFMMYDLFIGDPNCIHIVVFSLQEPQDVQMAQVADPTRTAIRTATALSQTFFLSIVSGLLLAALSQGAHGAALACG